MSFTAEELANIANMTIDYHMKNIHLQNVQEKPLLKDLLARSKAFPGGKDDLTVRVKGEYVTTIEGFTGDQQVGYGNPAKVKEARFQWKEVHWGIKFTGTELKKNGISIVDSNTGKSTSMASQREKIALANLLEDKLEDMSEGGNIGMNQMFLRDGTQDALLVPGIRSFILDDPTSATVVAGIDQSQNTWWRNRASLLLATGTPSDLVIIKEMSTERRQLRRFGGRPTKAYCGSDWLDAMEAEARAKGTFTDTGWASSGKLDVGMADQTLKGMDFVYDPTMDDEGLAKYCYALDLNAIKVQHMEGENFKQHFPSRPEDRYVYYRAITWTGGLTINRRRSSGVYSIA